MSAPSQVRSRRGQHGYSYVEILVATVLLAVALVPAMDALRDGLQAAAIDEDMAVQRQRLVGLMETVSAEPFTVLAAEVVASAGAPASYSDAAGTPYRRVVTLLFHDGDGDANPDLDLIHVRVAIETTPYAVETLVVP